MQRNNIPMIEILTKNRFPNYFYNQFIPIFTTFIVALILGYQKYSPIVISVSILILYCYSYFIHRLFHILPDYNIHIRFHHNVDKNQNKFIKAVYWLIELFLNIMFFVIFYFIQKFLRIDFVPKIMIFYYGFIYVTVHVINYSLFHASNKHIIHHTSCNDKLKVYNYGPDLVDHIFGTSSSTDFENYNHLMPNILMSFLITYYFYKPKII